MLIRKQPTNKHMFKVSNKKKKPKKVLTQFNVNNKNTRTTSLDTLKEKRV